MGSSMEAPTREGIATATMANRRDRILKLTSAVSGMVAGTEENEMPHDHKCLWCSGYTDGDIVCGTCGHTLKSGVSLSSFCPRCKLRSMFVHRGTQCILDEVTLELRRKIILEVIARLRLPDCGAVYA